MDANELRIGNWVLSTLLQKYPINTIQEGMPCPEPIPLTEEWLIDLGFEKVDVNLFEKRCLTLFIENGTWKWFLGDRAYKLGTEIKYVHTLQNLYFALTGEELIVK